MYIENYVREIVDKIIEKEGTTDPDALISSRKNIFVSKEHLCPAINGLYVYISEKKQMLAVNDSLEDFDRQYASFHEFGHSELGHKGRCLLNSTGVNDTKEEYEADLFSTYMIIIHNGITKENIDEFVLPKRVRELAPKFF